LALILNIDTATDLASVCLSENDKCLALLDNANQKEHASFVHVAVEQLLQQTGKSINQLDAIAVTAGPGSYTGLRVGLATAKGFCYALTKPLITASTLKVMAAAAVRQYQGQITEVLFCPMLDARRMEVFTGLFDQELNEMIPETSMILDENTFNILMGKHQIVFFGNGSNKFQLIMNTSNALFIDVQHSAAHLATLSWQAFQRNEFIGIAYAEPSYLKEFYTTAGKSKY
jgi:tRNA threonylcarbamoyladenosine biosynthesis protein TsaB